jgi:uncharacterized membrane protein
MKKYLTSIGIVIGGAIGLVVGILGVINMGVTIVIGAALGLIGASIYMIRNKEN